MNEILEQIERMSPDEVQRLIAILQRKSEQGAFSNPITEGEKQMLEPRVEEALGNPMGGRSWTQVKTSLLDQVGKPV